MLPECLTETRLVVALDRRKPDVDADGRIGQLVPALEVMVQEGQDVFSLCPADADVVPQLREIFDERAFFGVHGIAGVDDMRTVLDLEPTFVLADGDDAEVLCLGSEAGVATLPAALTPNEIRRAAGLGAPAVQVFPADLFGSSYPEQLQQLLPDVPLVARGGLGAWAAGRWYEAGAAACVADTALVGDALNGGNLSHLRDRMRSYREAASQS